jgi:hypothetical protein
MTSTQQSIRLNVNMNTDTAEGLRYVAEKYGITVTEALRRVVSLGYFLEKQTEDGSVVLVEDKKGKQNQLVMI